MCVRAGVICVVLVLLTSPGAPAQSDKSQSQTPAVALERIPFPSCPSAECTFANERDVAGFLADSLSFSQVPGGFSELSWEAEKGQSAYRYAFQPGSGRLRALLNSIVLAEPRYRWEIRDDVINMCPIHDYPFLETRIAEFGADNRTADEMILALTHSIDFKRGLDRLGLHGTDELKSERPPGQGGFWFVCELWRRDRFSVRFKNATVRQILNGIVRQDGSAVWHYREGWGHYHLSLMIG